MFIEDNVPANVFTSEFNLIEEETDMKARKKQKKEKKPRRKGRARKPVVLSVNRRKRVIDHHQNGTAALIPQLDLSTQAVTINQFLNKFTLESVRSGDVCEVNDCLSLFDSNFGEGESEDFAEFQKEFTLQQQRMLIEKNFGASMNFPGAVNTGFPIQHAKDLENKLNFLNKVDDNISNRKSSSTELEPLNCETLDVNSFDELLISDEPFQNTEENFNYNNELLIFNDEVSVDLIEDIIEKHSNLNAGEKMSLTNCMDMLEKAKMEKISVSKQDIIGIN